MAQKPIAMEQLKQILQLYSDGVSIREITRRAGISRNSVRKYLLRFNDVKQNLSDDELVDTAYDNDLIELEAERLRQLTAHFNTAGTELSKTGVTRQLLWQEYLAQHPDGYSYSRYCYHLSQYFKNRDLSMHMEYQCGDMIMIDFAGKKQYYVDIDTGEQIACQVFVAIMPYSGFIFCRAVPSQQTADFTHCINSMLKFYGGVPATIVCDNLKTAVTRADRYEPQFTDICEQLSEHYHTTFTATRPYSPRDKAMVERAVNIVYTHVYAPLRHQNFTSLAALNTALGQQLMLLNDKPYKNTPYSRRWFFEQQERPGLKPLPPEPFAAKKVVWLTVQRNYHVQLSENHHYYSVPYQHAGKKVKVMYDKDTVEVYLDGSRIAVHSRRLHNKAYTTLGEHMPPHHQKMQQIKGFNRDDLLAQAARTGTSVLEAAKLILENSIYVEQNYKSCFGMLMLHKKYTAARLDAACARALQGTRVNYTMIKNILERGLDKQTQLPLNNPVTPEHDNIRGKDHYR
jgi:transposase